MTATMIAYGATMTHLLVPNKMGTMSDVILGWDDLTQYCANAQHTYFGATIGRIANRVAKCEFPLNGKTYKLSCNEKDFDTLHGGIVGFDRRVWTSVAMNSSSVTWVRAPPCKRHHTLCSLTGRGVYLRTY
jgi:aldose 1-epimerase